MEYQFERLVKINRSPKFTMGGSWSIIEEDLATGKSIDYEYVPWDSSLYFSSEEIFWRSSIGNDYSIRGEKLDGKFDSSEVIYGKLSPVLGRRSNTKYSMFGTGRTISDFNIRIELVSDDFEEECRAFGWVQHEHEWDFEIQQHSDLLDFIIKLRSDNFSKIRKAIEHQLPFILTLCVRGVSGFYAEWSPSIRTEFVKVLANTDDQILDVGDEAINPPVLGNIRNFSISIDSNLENTSIKKINNFEDDDVDRNNEIHQTDAKSETSDAQMNNEKLLKQNKLLLRAIKSTAVAAWLILLWLLLHSFQRI